MAPKPLDLIRRLLPAVAAAALSGCAAQSYEEPQSGARARVRFSTDTMQAAVLRQYGDGACRSQESEIVRLRDGPFALDAKEVYVPAGKALYGLFIGSDRHTAGRDATTGQVTTLFEHCGVPFSFVFDEGASYEVAFRRAICSVEIYRIERDAAGVSARIAQSAGPMDFAACRKVFEKRRF